MFGLILAGFVCRRTGVLGPNAAPELNRFVVWLALPALLFDVMAHASWQQFNQPAFVATFALACGAVFGLILILRVLSGRHLADALEPGDVAGPGPEVAQVLGHPVGRHRADPVHRRVGAGRREERGGDHTGSRRVLRRHGATLHRRRACTRL